MGVGVGLFRCLKEPLDIFEHLQIVDDVEATAAHDQIAAVLGVRFGALYWIVLEDELEHVRVC